ncbi:MAG TPA: YncE family protein [Gemmatimonadota bacterium]|nr:YncE family protein [Gemmatimonadota bacterium]
MIMGLRACSLVAALVLACASAPSARMSPPGAGATPAPEGLGPFLYVANQNGASVSIIDVAKRAESDRVDLQALGFGPNAKPHDTAVDPDGSHWYVTLIGENRVLKFDRSNRLVGQVEMEVPGLVVAHPTRDLLLVGRSMTAVDPPSSIALIRRSDMTLLDEIEVLFPRPHALAAGAGGDWAYTASLAVNQIAAFELESGDVRLVDVPAAGGEFPEEPVTAEPAAGAHGAAHTAHTLVEFAISPDGRTMVAGGEISGDLVVFDLSDPGAPRVVRTVHLGGAPWHPAFTPDGRYVWVPLHRADAVAVVDASSWEVVERIGGRGLAQPHAVQPSPDGRWIFVSSNNTEGTYTPEGDDPLAGTIVVIDPEARRIVDVLEVGPNAAGIETLPARSPR